MILIESYVGSAECPRSGRASLMLATIWNVRDTGGFDGLRCLWPAQEVGRYTMSRLVALHS